MKIWAIARISYYLKLKTWSENNTLGGLKSDFYENKEDNISIQLKDIVVEEEILNDISIALLQKKPLLGLCSNWWISTEKFSIKDLYYFVIKDASKSIIKIYQSLLWLIIGFIEINEAKLYTK